MTTKKTVSHSHVSHAHVSHKSDVSTQEVPMTTHKTASHSHVSSSQSQSPEPQALQTEALAVSTPVEVAPHTATPVASAAATAPIAAPVASASTPTPAPVSFALAAPPSNAVIPPVPSDYVAQSGATYRSVAPKKTELLVLAQAVKNLAQFASYTQVMGPYAPPYEETLALFTVVNQWSAMRTASSAWDAYSVDQEGLGWATLRPVMDRLRPLFDIAVSADPTLLVKLPSLATLLGARAAIAQKGAATRKRNKQSKAKGDPQTHGKAGKTRKRAEEKAALETVQEQQSSAPAAGATGAAGQAAPPGQGTVTTAPVTVVTTPAPTAPTSAVNAPSAVPAVTNGVNGLANGAAH